MRLGGILVVLVLGLASPARADVTSATAAVVAVIPNEVAMRLDGDSVVVEASGDDWSLEADGRPITFVAAGDGRFVGDVPPGSRELVLAR